MKQKDIAQKLVEQQTQFRKKKQKKKTKKKNNTKQKGNVIYQCEEEEDGPH